ncbi:hypothetical protein C5167_033506 [Papaver somniferum]|uniref:Uncharacterized protein n=1 Tax=Papaver somniferum TaxID=3469 RepID=A0A4Y7KEI4_PAPSO|nr:hypothetical protein C5167_033506 [Papaver somniferum]
MKRFGFEMYFLLQNIKFLSQFTPSRTWVVSAYIWYGYNEVFIIGYNWSGWMYTGYFFSSW